jgi:hypothetical protein
MLATVQTIKAMPPGRERTRALAEALRLYRGSIILAALAKALHA